MSERTATITEAMRGLRSRMAVIAEYPRPTAAQHEEWTRLVQEFETLDAQRAEAQRVEDSKRTEEWRAETWQRLANGGGGLEVERGSSGEQETRVFSDPNSLAVRSDESLVAWGRRTGRMRGGDPSLSFDKLIRGMASGEWGGAEAELRAVSEAPATSGGHLVPAPLSAGVIDRARAAAKVAMLGSTIVPMLSATAKFPRLASGLIPDWRNENDPIADKALTFDAVTLTARSLACRVNISWELFDDAPPASDVIEREFAAAFALEWDRVALRGTGTAPEPRGLRNTSGVTTTTLSPPNGASLTSYDWLLDAVQTIRASNFEPTGVLASPRTETALAKLREGGSTGMYLAPPSALANLPRLVSNQLPTNITTGTSNDTSEVFVGDWRHLLLGIRTSLRIRLLTERYADVGQFSFLADFRGDVGVTQASAFNIVAGIRP